MSRIRRFATVALLLLFAGGPAVTACDSGPEERAHRGHGIIQAVDASKGKVTIDHEEIPGLMKAMTMTFTVSDPSILASVTAGQEVDFRVKEESGRYVVTVIESR